MLIWFILLLYGLFLPSDPIKTDLEREIFAIEDNRPKTDCDLTSHKLSTDDGDNDCGGSSTFPSKTSNKVQGDSEDDICLSNLMAQRGCLQSMVRVVGLYYVIFLSLFVFVVVSFYIPLLAKYHLGLDLSFVKFLYLNSTLFTLILFIASAFMFQTISENKALLVLIFSQIIPISIAFYFGLSWYNTMSVNASYLLIISMLLLSVQFLNVPLASSLLSKITPIEDASFYIARNTRHAIAQSTRWLDEFSIIWIRAR